jgi:predicted dehydrogenase
MGKNWANNLRDCPQVKTVGWMDIRAGAAAEAIEEKKLTAVSAYDDLSKALAELRPDFVVDVTSPESHHDVTLAALAAGIPVLGEKPMTDSMERAREMVRASEKSGKLYMVSQSRRYHAGAVEFARLVREYVSPLGILNSDFYVGAHFSGFRAEMKSVLLLDMAIHTFDSARQFSGCDAVSVYCEEFCPDWSWNRGTDSAVALFEMTGGLRYDYRGSWCAEGLPTSWEAQWRAHGPSAAATWDGENPPIAARVKSDGELIHESEKIVGEIPAHHFGGIAGSLREFLHALETGEVPQGECHDNIKSLAMVFAALESAGTGRRVKIQI